LLLLSREDLIGVCIERLFRLMRLIKKLLQVFDLRSDPRSTPVSIEFRSTRKERSVSDPIFAKRKKNRDRDHSHARPWRFLALVTGRPARSRDREPFRAPCLPPGIMRPVLSPLPYLVHVLSGPIKPESRPPDLNGTEKKGDKICSRSIDRRDRSRCAAPERPPRASLVSARALDHRHGLCSSVGRPICPRVVRLPVSLNHRRALWSSAST
jgi:hypothetical protein